MLSAGSSEIPSRRMHIGIDVGEEFRAMHRGTRPVRQVALSTVQPQQGTPRSGQAGMETPAIALGERCSLTETSRDLLLGRERRCQLTLYQLSAQ
jgi:hypothetical protein